MSSGQKAVYEDGEDWETFQKLHRLQAQRWQLYSKEQRYAEQGVKLGFKGNCLIDFVTICNRRDSMNQQDAEEAKERALYEKLHEKYGKNVSASASIKSDGSIGPR